MFIILCSCLGSPPTFQPPHAQISTSMNNQMFVAYRDVQKGRKDTAIEVYETMTFALEKHIAVPGLRQVRFRQVRCLTSCAAIECLYVSDSRTCNVFRVGVSGTGYATSWRVGTRPAGLSATTIDNVLVTFPDEFCVREYTPHGSLVSHLSLEYRPDHVAKLVGDRFAVSSDQGVCIVNETGQTVCKYSSGRRSVKLKRPMGLVAVKNGCILVADLNRIVILNPSLSSARMLALPIKDALRGPWTGSVTWSTVRW